MLFAIATIHWLQVIAVHCIDLLQIRYYSFFEGSYFSQSVTHLTVHFDVRLHSPPCNAFASSCLIYPYIFLSFLPLLLVFKKCFIRYNVYNLCLQVFSLEFL